MRGALWLTCEEKLSNILAFWSVVNPFGDELNVVESQTSCGTFQYRFDGDVISRKQSVMFFCKGVQVSGIYFVGAGSENHKRERNEQYKFNEAVMIIFLY